MNVSFGSKIILTLACTAALGCGPDSDDNNTNNTNNASNNANNANNGTGPDDVITDVGTVSVATDHVILQTALNSDGSLIAIATQTPDLADHVTVYSTSDGAEVITMSELGTAGAPLTNNLLIETDALLWGDNDELTAVLSYTNTYTWNPSTGEVLRSKLDLTLADECAGPDDFEAFHPTGTLAFASTQGAPGTNTICKLDLAANTREVVTLAEGPVVEWAAFNTTGDVLWVSFSDPSDANFFSKEIVATVAYNPATMAPTGETLATPANVIAAGGGYFVTNDPQVSLAPGGELNAVDARALVAPTGTVIVADIPNESEINVIRIPEGNVIGRLPDDDANSRSFSHDGNILAVVDDGRTMVSVHDVSETTTYSAFVPPVMPPAGVASGTITIDGVEETIDGNCEVIVDDAIGAVQFTTNATTSGGWSLRAHAQNALLYSSYRLEKDGVEYVNNNVIAQNFELEFPTSESDGTTMKGTANLVTFDPNELLVLVPDAAHPTGYKTVEITLDASCAQ